MKILIASIPAPGHLNPLLSVASLLVESGHEVAIQVNEDLRPAVEAAAHRFLSEIPNAQTPPGYYFDSYPERMQKSPGMEMTGKVLGRKKFTQRQYLGPVLNNAKVQLTTSGNFGRIPGHEKRWSPIPHRCGRSTR
jgi:UDP:flavonoid glycosyltransferase YjiC (YdhE family)